MLIKLLRIFAPLYSFLIAIETWEDGYSWGFSKGWGRMIKESIITELNKMEDDERWLQTIVANMSSNQTNACQFHVNPFKKVVE